MRDVDVNLIKGKIKDICLELATVINADVEEALLEAKGNEIGLGLNVMDVILNNAKIARDNNMPLCQDTGIVVVFVEYGQDVHFINGSLEQSINQGVREAYEEGYLRKSIVLDPLKRNNSKDNTPAMIHYEMVEGEGVTLKVMLKGFGSENMSKIKMLKPSDGVDGIKKFVKECIEVAGGNPCPPTVVGVGIGGTMDKAAHLSKEALFRKIGQRSELSHIEELEMELLSIINDTNVGPMGFSGKTTALDVFVEIAPTHIAGLPVAVNINCHSLRRKIVTV